MTKQADDIGKSEYVAIGTAVVIAVSLILAPTIFLDNQLSKSTPEDTLNDWADSINNHDARGALDLTLYAFADQWWLTQMLSWLNAWFHYPASKQIEIDNITVLYERDFNIGLIDEIEEYFSAEVNRLTHDEGPIPNVQEYCLISFSINLYAGESVLDVSFPTILGVKVDSIWYIENIIGF